MMATQSSSLPDGNALESEQERALTHEEWWQLFDQLRLSQQQDYAEYGGPVAFFRQERDADPGIA